LLETGVIAKRTRFSPEVRERAVRMVYEHASGHPSEWAALTSIASKIWCSAQTLSTWIKRRAVDRGERPGVSTEEQARVKALERENRELRRANEILRKASAYFSQAELDRRGT
jgi:transposase